MTKSSSHSGFTIIETLVAITILAMVIAAVSKAVQTAITSYTLSSDQVIASYLAQEGIEQVRNLRDENNLKGVGWLNGLGICLDGPKCIVDATLAMPNTFAVCSGTCENVRQNTALNTPLNGLYGHDINWSSWVSTPYRREIQLTTVSGTEVTITATVYWSKGPISRSLKLKENIFNW